MQVFDHDHRGCEFDWLALDQNGLPGYFSTAGEGWIPSQILDLSGDPEDPAKLVSRLPDRGAPTVLYKGKGVVTDWIQVGRKGIYAFDWNRSAERYELIASPRSVLPHAEFGDLSAMFYRVILEGSFDPEF